MTNRDLDLEARSFTHHRSDRDTVPQQIDNASDNRQAKTYAAATRRSKLVELLEDGLHFRTGDAATRIVHGSCRVPGWWDGSPDQAADEGTEQRLAAATGIVHQLEETEIERQLLLRDAAVRAQPRAQR
jgi:hypothetical protein